MSKPEKWIVGSCGVLGLIMFFFPIAPLISIFIGLVFLASILIVIGALLSLRLVKTASIFGAICALVAVIHLKVLNSELHRAMREMMSDSSSELEGNPFAELAEGISEALFGGMNLGPGIGLYLLAISLAIAAILSFSRVMSRVRLEPVAD